MLQQDTADEIAIMAVRAALEARKEIKVHLVLSSEESVRFVTKLAAALIPIIRDR
jgi:hypothetical protein